MRFLKSISNLFRPATQKDKYASLLVVDEWTIVPLFFNLSLRQFLSAINNAPRKNYNVNTKIVRSTFKSKSTITPYNLQEAASLLQKYTRAFPPSSQEDVVHYMLGVLPGWCELLSLHVKEIQLVKALTFDINSICSFQRALIIRNESYFTSFITIPSAYEAELPNLFDINFLRSWDKANEERKFFTQALQEVAKPVKPSNKRKNKI
jgi:hypothetical protein